MAIEFPPRNETYEFHLSKENGLNLDYKEAKYPALFHDTKTDQDVHEDMEGLIVWTEGYLRRRVNGESHAQATKNTRNEARQGLGLDPL